MISPRIAFDATRVKNERYFAPNGHGNTVSQGSPSCCGRGATAMMTPSSS